MLKFTKRTEYGLMALSYISKLEDGQVSTAKEIAENYNISFQLLAKVLQDLARAEYLAPVQGSRGGYKLQIELKELSLREYLIMMEGGFELVDCIRNGSCDNSQICGIQTPIVKINNRINDLLDSTPLMSILNEENK